MRFAVTPLVLTPFVPFRSFDQTCCCRQRVAGLTNVCPLTSSCYYRNATWCWKPCCCKQERLETVRCLSKIWLCCNRDVPWKIWCWLLLLMSIKPIITLTSRPPVRYEHLHLVLVGGLLPAVHLEGVSLSEALGKITYSARHSLTAWCMCNLFSMNTDSQLCVCICAGMLQLTRLGQQMLKHQPLSANP